MASWVGYTPAVHTCTITSTNIVLYALYICMALRVYVCTVYGIVCVCVRCMALCVCVLGTHTQLYICGSKHLPVD